MPRCQTTPGNRTPPLELVPALLEVRWRVEQVDIAVQDLRGRGAGPDLGTDCWGGPDAPDPLHAGRAGPAVSCWRGDHGAARCRPPHGPMNWLPSALSSDARPLAHGSAAACGTPPGRPELHRTSACRPGSAAEPGWHPGAPHHSCNLELADPGEAKRASRRAPGAYQGQELEIRLLISYNRRSRSRPPCGAGGEPQAPHRATGRWGEVARGVPVPAAAGEALEQSRGWRWWWW
jgi:hypothetical protein